MSSDDIDLGQQTGFATQLSNSLAEVNAKLNIFADASRSQAKFAISIANSFEKTDQYLTNISNSTEKINDCLGDFLQGVKNLTTTSGMNEFFKNFVKHIDNSTERYKKTAQATEELAEASKKAQTTSEKSQESLNRAASEEKKYSTAQSKQTKKYIENLTKANKSAEEHNKVQEEFANAAEKAQEAGRSWAQSFKSAVSIGFNLIKIIGSLISTATTWVKTVFTLPFMVLKNVVKAGNALRTDLVTVIEQAAQETKEFFDSFSDIGQGIRRMTSMGKGMLLEFENVNSDAVKLFGQGAAGIATMIKETASAIKAMGHYSEMFGSTITKNRESLFHFTRIKKAIGLEDNQIAYYAQDAALSLTGLNKRLTTMALLTDDVSKQYGVDMKRLGKNFNKLRTDIALYGHLSDEELLKTTARLTQMKISVEDASSVFKKFSTFEDAANSVAMLSQTFGMNLDAMEIIQAKNPEDIINMFRDSMIATGRTFDEFNRFEKEILADQTGMSQEGLKALMTLRDKGLTHQEAVDAMKDQTPEAKQLKAIKELSSSINMLQKVMNFTSPFEAFMKGLGKNAAASKEARTAFMSLSNTYQMIHDFALNLDGDTVSALLEPVILIVDVMKNILNSPGFRGGLTSLVRGFSNLAMNLFGVTESDKIYVLLEKNINGMTKNQSKKFATDLLKIEQDIEKFSVKNLYKKYMSNKKMSKKGNFKKFLKEFKAKSLKDPAVKKEFDLFMKNFHKKYDMASFKTIVKTGDVKTVTNDFQKELKNTLQGNTGNFEKFFDISGRTAGAIIKGAAILLTSGLNVLNSVISKVDTEGIEDSNGQSLIESFFKWEPGTLMTLGTSLLNALKDTFKSTGKLSFFGIWITEQFSSLLMSIGSFFWTTLKATGRQIWPDLFGSSESMGEVMTKASTGKEGYRLDSKKQVESNKFDSSKLEGQKSFASKLMDVKDADSSGSFKSITSDLTKKAYAGIAEKSDYNLLSAMKGFQENFTGKNKMTEADAEIFGGSTTAIAARKNKEKDFDKALSAAWKNDIFFNKDWRDSVEKRMSNKKMKFPGVPNTAGSDSPDFSQTPWAKGYVDAKKVADGYNLDAPEKTNEYYRLFGKLINRFDKMSTEELTKEAFGSQNSNFYEEALLRGKSFKESRNKFFQSQIEKAKREYKGKETMKAFAIGDGLVDTTTSLSSTFAAKPGGFVDRMFSGLSSLSSDVTETSANVSSLYSGNQISSEGNKLTNKKVENICKRLEEYKEAAKDPKLIDIPFDISDEICDLLGTKLVQRGLLDKMSRPDIMSASTTRLRPSASTAGNLQTGRQGINPGQEYLYYENG